MCGITGFWGDVIEHQVVGEMLEQMTSSLAHRGPDGTSYWIGTGVGLGHTRLAIIDIEGGSQPLWDVSQRYVIVFNGEIYNYRELRGELEARGYKFRTRSDTEIIPAAIKAWGVDGGLRRLRGMFAFALYDLATRKLLLARDRLGIKPLYLAFTGKGVLFASEQKALLASGLVSRRANPIALHDFLTQGYATSPDTCWADIQMLEPGTWLEIGPEGKRTGRYWKWLPRKDSSMGLNEAIENTRNKLQDSVQCHLIADVPVGVFLSGGLDSSLIVALLSGISPGFRTFNMGFGDSSHDESVDARRVANHCATNHCEVRMENGHADPDVFKKILEQYDEPFGDSSCIPVYLISEEIRKHVKVVLSGDGGDEVLGGYMRYVFAKRLAQLSLAYQFSPLLGRTLALAGKSMGGRCGARAVKASRYAQMSRAQMLCALHTVFSEDERLKMYTPDFARLALSAGPTVSRFESFIPKDLDDPIQQLIGAEMGLRLHADYLKKVDVASSAHGLEVRVPYLDSEMLDLAAQMPGQLKINSRGQTKIIPRRIVKSLLPPEIAAKPKQGFDVPLDRWIGKSTRDFIRDLLLDSSAGISHLIRKESIEQVWREFELGETSNGLTRAQRSHRVFMLTSLELWMKKWSPSFN